MRIINNAAADAPDDDADYELHHASDGTEMA